MIRDISEILRRSVRIFDVCTRFGGEEFAVMMPGGTAESAGAIAERIRQRVEAYQRSEPDLADLRVTASIGVAVSPPGVTASDLIERADRALYHAKKAGKNRVSTAAVTAVFCLPEIFLRGRHSIGLTPIKFPALLNPALPQVPENRWNSEEPPL